MSQDKWALPTNVTWQEVDDSGFPPPLLVGDRVLVAIPLYGAGNDYHVIVATERGFDDAGGDSWSAWDWSDVSHYCLLQAERKDVEA